MKKIKRGKYIYDFIFEKENHKINKIFEIGCGYGGILRYLKIGLQCYRV